MSLQERFGTKPFFFFFNFLFDPGTFKYFNKQVKKTQIAQIMNKHRLQAVSSSSFFRIKKQADIY